MIVDDDVVSNSKAVGPPGDQSSTMGPVTRALLGEIAPREDLTPIAANQGPTRPTGRFEIEGVIGRGGMGEVLRGRDPLLGRDVAVKVLREDLRENVGLSRRFLEEARIGGQLQHPGVVPVYELGTFVDTRPYFAMKLVKGETLAALLESRSGPAEDLPRYLGIFIAIAQTIAYAHTRGVVHRDLKPANVMVGAFGEVQVMDWGLAKVLRKGDAPSEGQARDSFVAMVRQGDDSDLSRAGSVLGTPSYMAPEQARGEVDRIDERCDVFALGAILCEVLTGRPAFTGRTASEIIAKAGRGDTGEALARLAECAADRDLVDLARDCLAPERDERPREAALVAERMTAYLSGVQERLRMAEIARAAESARAEEATKTAAQAEERALAERRARRFQIGLAASVLVFTTFGGLGFTYLLQQRVVRAAALAKVVGEAATLVELARAVPEDETRWRTALTAILQAERAAESDGPGEAQRRLADLHAEALAGAESAERDRTLLDRLAEVRSAVADDAEGDSTDLAYSAAFREAGLDPEARTPAGWEEALRSRPLSIVPALVSALDHWSAVRRNMAGDFEGAERLAAISSRIDPDPWRNELRAALAEKDRERLKSTLGALADEPDLEERGPVGLSLLGGALEVVGAADRAESVLRGAQRRYPADIWLNFELAQLMRARGRRQDAIRFHTAARAIRPETAHELAHALEEKGERDEAIAVFRDLVRLRPGNGRHLYCLAMALKDGGGVEEAATILDRAIGALRDEARLRPTDFRTHTVLGNALNVRGRSVEAIEEHREAIRLRPKDARPHGNLGLALSAAGRNDEAIAAYRVSLSLDPNDARVHYNLGCALDERGRHDEAVAAFQEAIRLQPDHSFAHTNLGGALKALGRTQEAVGAYAEGVRLSPGNARAHGALGSGLASLGEWEKAEAAFREATRLDPDLAIAHFNLGIALESQGKYEEALAAFRRAEALAPPGSPDAAGIPEKLRQIEERVAFAARVRAVLAGEEKAPGPEETLAFALFCYETKRFAAATRFYEEALRANSKLGQGRDAQHAYNAACAAALAAAGAGTEDGTPLDDTSKAKLRAQALEWLKAEFGRWSKVLEDHPGTRSDVLKALSWWREDPDLTSVREAEALNKLPADERKEWEALWEEVTALLETRRP